MGRADLYDLFVRALDGMTTGRALPLLCTMATNIMLCLPDDRPMFVGDHLGLRGPVADDTSFTVRVFGDLFATVYVIVEYANGYPNRFENDIRYTTADREDDARNARATSNVGLTDEVGQGPALRALTGWKFATCFDTI